LSKLFDQLKGAARSREEKSPGLLVDALKRQQEGAAGPPEAVAPAQAGAQSAVPTPVTPGAPEAQRTGGESPSRISSISGIGLAILIFAVAVVAWRSAPWVPPKKLKIDPSELRLDRSLDLQRTTPKGTSPAGRPS
jgi:hypothetical protein